MVGAYDFFDNTNNGQVNGALAPRSPGSALTPFIYAPGLEHGVISPRGASTTRGNTPLAYRREILKAEARRLLWAPKWPHRFCWRFSRRW